MLPISYIKASDDLVLLGHCLKRYDKASRTWIGGMVNV